LAISSWISFAKIRRAGKEANERVPFVDGCYDLFVVLIGEWTGGLDKIKDEDKK
jgi:hypothetical protein